VLRSRLGRKSALKVARSGTLRAGEYVAEGRPTPPAWLLDGKEG